MGDAPEGRTEAGAASAEAAPPPAKESDGGAGGAIGAIVGILLIAAIWVGGACLARWLWHFSWFVSALMAPVAVAVLYVALIVVRYFR
jgi:hypothetical protein